MENNAQQEQALSNEVLLKILRELEKTNAHFEALETLQKNKVEEEKTKQEEERLRAENGEKTLEEQTLQELKNVSSGVASLNKISDEEQKTLDYLENIQQYLEKNQEETLTEKNLNQLVTVIQKDYQQIEMTSRIVNSYGLLIIPVSVVLLILYGLLKDFI